MNRVALIMAGGSGERFWPLSRSIMPKQFLKLFSDISLVRESFLRANFFIEEDNIFIVCAEKYREKITAEIPEFKTNNFIIEPCAKDTAAAIALATLYIKKRLANASILVCASDHMIDDKVAFKHNIDDAFKIAHTKEAIITIGIKPTYPETNYGYIELDKKANQDNYGQEGFYKVKSFREKPDYTKASTFLKAGNFLWNSGMFVFTATTFLKELSLYMPALYKGLLEIEHEIGTTNEKMVQQSIFKSLEKISIDFGIMERTNNILCIKSSFKWDDLGSWNAYFRFFKEDKHRNITKGRVLTQNTDKSLILGDNDGLIGVIGLSNIIVVKTKDALLICDRNSDGDIKKLLSDMKKDDSLSSYL